MSTLLPEEIVFIAVIGLMLLFAVVSNSVVIYCVAKFRKLRTVTNVFISNLAVSDIILAGFVLPQRLHDISHTGDYFEGEALCKIVNFCPIFVITSSIYTLVAISFERHRAIIHNNLPQVTMLQLTKIIPVIWAFGFLVSMPTLLEYQVNDIALPPADNTTNATGTLISCGNQHVPFYLTLIDAVFVTVVSYVIPVVLMIRNYTQLAIFVWKRGRQIKDAPGSMGNNAQSYHLFRNRVKLVNMLVLVAVVFAVTWLPFFIAMLLARVTGDDTSEESGGFLNLFLITVATISTAYNVVLYVVFNPSYRKAIATVFGCRKNFVVTVTHTVSRPDFVATNFKPVTVNTCM